MMPKFGKNKSLFKYYLIIIAIIMSYSNVFADDYIGKQLLAFCDSAFNKEMMKSRFEVLQGDESWKETIKASSEGAACISYIKGTVAAFIIANVHIDKVLEKKEKVLYCKPRDVSFDQAEQIIYKYLNNHPEKLQEPASLLILFALKEAFPCK
jgi:Ssp1 endopeptidase immunity protein Rap1a